LFEQRLQTLRRNVLAVYWSRKIRIERATGRAVRARRELPVSKFVPRFDVDAVMSSGDPTNGHGGPSLFTIRFWAIEREQASA